jgi:membrane protease YdiL (CAAX protease family)
MMTTSATGEAALARRSGLLTYFLGAYALTWLFWVPAALAARGLLDLPVPGFLLLILGGLGPMLAAILVGAYESGGAGVRALFGQLLRWRVSLRWYLIALLGIAALELSVVPVRLASGGLVDGGALLGALGVAPFHFLFVALVGGGLDEEMGWRGYALPRLQGRLGPLAANLLLGVLWAFWHLPLWFVPGSFQAGSSFGLYVVSTVALSFLIGWVYNGTGGSLLLAILAHTASDVADNLRAAALGPSGLGGELLLTGAFVAAAVTVVVLTRGTLAAERAGEPTVMDRGAAVGRTMGPTTVAARPDHE